MFCIAAVYINLYSQEFSCVLFTVLFAVIVCINLCAQEFSCNNSTVKVCATKSKLQNSPKETEKYSGKM